MFDKEVKKTPGKNIPFTKWSWENRIIPCKKKKKKWNWTALLCHSEIKSKT